VPIERAEVQGPLLDIILRLELARIIAGMPHGTILATPHLEVVVHQVPEPQRIVILVALEQVEVIIQEEVVATILQEEAPAAARIEAPAVVLEAPVVVRIEALEVALEAPVQEVLEVLAAVALDHQVHPLVEAAEEETNQFHS